MGQNLDAFDSKLADSGAAERANKDLFLADLCAVLGVAPPDPSTGDPERDLYVFEREAKLAHEGGEATIGRIDLYAAFDGSGNFQPFPNAQNNRLFLRDLGKHRDTLRGLFDNPLDLDPSKHAAKITREVAGHLANLAKKLEADGNDQALVAEFLMRCLFTMFAEDVGLLPEELFTKELRDRWLPHPELFPSQIEQLWRTMNAGGEIFGVVGKILRFNGGLFANPKALRLDKKALGLLLEAAKCNWSASSPPSSAPCWNAPWTPKSATPWARTTPRAPTSSAWCARPSRSRCAPIGTSSGRKSDASSWRPSTPRPPRPARTSSRKPSRSCAPFI
jgi:hypothetical protein